MRREHVDEIYKIKYTETTPGTYKSEILKYPKRSSKLCFELQLGSDIFRLPVLYDSVCVNCSLRQVKPRVMGRIYYPTKAFYGEEDGLGEYGTIDFCENESPAKAEILDSSLRIAKFATNLGTLSYELQMSISDEWNKFICINEILGSMPLSKVFGEVYNVNRHYIKSNAEHREYILKRIQSLDDNMKRVMENSYGGPLAELPRALFYIETIPIDHFTDAWYFANLDFALSILRRMNAFQNKDNTANDTFYATLSVHEQATTAAFAFTLFVSQMTYKPDGFNYGDSTEMSQFEWFSRNATRLLAGDCEDFALLLLRMCRGLQQVYSDIPMVQMARKALRQYVPCNALVKAHAASLKFRGIDAANASSANPQLQNNLHHLSLQEEKAETTHYSIFHMTCALIPVQQFRHLLNSPTTSISDVDEDDGSEKRTLFVEGTVCLFPDMFKEGLFDTADLENMQSLAQKDFKESNLLVTPSYCNVASGTASRLPSMYGNVIQLCTDSMINQKNYDNEEAFFCTIFNVLASAKDSEDTKFLAPLAKHFGDANELDNIFLEPDLPIREIVPKFMPKTGKDLFVRHMNHWSMDLELMNPTMDVDLNKYFDEKDMRFFNEMIPSSCKSYHGEMKGGISYLPFNLSVPYARSPIYFKQAN